MAATTGRHTTRGDKTGPAARRRADGRWACDVTISPGKRQTVYGASEDEARAKATVLLREVAARSAYGTPEQTLGDYLRAWLGGRGGRITDSTRVNYRHRLDTVTAHLGSVEMGALKPMAIRKLYADLLAERLSGTSVLNIHRTLSAALHDAVRLEIIIRNPASLVEPPREDTAERRALSSDELRALFEAASGTRYRLLWMVLGVMGLRIGEALALDDAGLDCNKRLCLVERGLTYVVGTGLVRGRLKTAKSRRVVGVPEIVAAEAERHRWLLARNPNPGGLLFPTRRGTLLHPNTVSWALTSHCRGAGLPRITAHELRHTAITQLLSAGVSPLLVAGMAGHATSRLTTDRYGHLLPGHQAEVAAAMDAILAGAL